MRRKITGSPVSVSVTVLISEELKQRLMSLAFKQSTPEKMILLSDIIRQALPLGLDKLEVK